MFYILAIFNSSTTALNPPRGGAKKERRDEADVYFLPDMADGAYALRNGDWRRREGGSEG